MSGKRRAPKDDARVEPTTTVVGGPRTARSAQRAALRRRRRRLTVAGVMVLALLAAGATALLVTGDGLSTPADGDDPDAPIDVTDQPTLLAVRQGPGAEASGLTLVATDPDDGAATVVFIPAGTLVDIPGHQLDRVGAALAYGNGDPQLTRSAVESALGIVIDHVALFTDDGLAAFLDRTGGLEVDVRERVVLRDEDGAADVRFEAGVHELDGPRLAELWRVRGTGADELESFPRQQQVWTALGAAIADDAGLAEELAGDGAPPLGADAEAEWLTDILGDLGAAADSGQLRFQLLPVELISAEGPDEPGTYRLARDDAAALVADALAGSVPPGGGADSVRVEVLNGVGTPGIGAQVDGLLDAGRFRLVRSDNARSFDFDQTLVLIYDETSESLAAAEAVQAALGVGTIQVSRQPQSVVDLTIVVGHDFLGDQPDDAGDAVDADAPDDGGASDDDGGAD